MPLSLCTHVDTDLHENHRHGRPTGTRYTLIALVKDFTDQLAHAVCQIVEWNSCIHALEVINYHPCFLVLCVFVEAMQLVHHRTQSRIVQLLRYCPSSHATLASSISSHRNFSKPCSMAQRPCRPTDPILSCGLPTVVQSPEMATYPCVSILMPYWLIHRWLIIWVALIHRNTRGEVQRVAVQAPFDILNTSQPWRKPTVLYPAPRRKTYS